MIIVLVLKISAAITGNASWNIPDTTMCGLVGTNIPNIGKNVPDTMCALGDIRNNNQHIPDIK